MRPLVLAPLLVMLACGHARPASGPAPGSAFSANGIRHAVSAVELAEGLDANSVPEMFEQLFCTAMFDLNDRQVVCAEEVRLLHKIQRNRTNLGESALSPDEVVHRLQAPRRVGLSASRAGDRVGVVALVSDAGGSALGRFQVHLAADGSDLQERAVVLARQVLSLR